MPADLSPTARALRTLEILQSRPGTTAVELAGQLAVTERAARRYITILREPGLPVEPARGPCGGYRLGRGTRLPPVLFTEAEALGLVMTVLDGQPAAAGTDTGDPAGAALGKVIRALTGNIGRQAAALREHASTAPGRYLARPGPATTSALVAAVATRRRVLLRYRSESGRGWEPEVDPWAVVIRYGRWYLPCHSITPTRSGPTGLTASVRSSRPPASSSHPTTSTRSRHWRKTWAPGGSSPPASSSTHPRPR